MVTDRDGKELKVGDIVHYKFCGAYGKIKELLSDSVLGCWATSIDKLDNEENNFLRLPILGQSLTLIKNVSAKERIEKRLKDDN